MKGLPFDINARINQSLQTKGNNADPQMQVVVARAKSSVMDSTYFTVENIQTKEGLTDISIAPRRQQAQGAPDGLFVMNIDNGNGNILFRKYPDKLREWTPQFSVGPAKSVAITFNGDWGRYRNRWQLITETTPYLFWVDYSNTLYVQKWEDATSKLPLSSSVLKVKVLRAWKSIAIDYLDQGLIAGYIKTDGKVYYRNYAIQEDGTITWEYEKQVETFAGTAVNLNLFLTNDYRMGFVIEDSLGNITWHISTRNWAGMASPMEYINTRLKVGFKVIAIDQLKTINHENINVGVTHWFNVARPIYPEVLMVENPDESEVQLKIKFNHIIDYDLTQVKSAFSIRDSKGKYFTINSTEPGIDNSEIIFNMNNFSSASGSMFIKYTRGTFLTNADYESGVPNFTGQWDGIRLDSVNDGSRFGIESFDFGFTPILTPPQVFTDEYITVGVTTNFTIRSVTYKEGVAKDYIDVSIKVGFNVIKLSEDPL